MTAKVVPLDAVVKFVFRNSWALGGNELKRGSIIPRHTCDPLCNFHFGPLHFVADICHLLNISDRNHMSFLRLHTVKFQDQTEAVACLRITP
jgi:hypothetical protein